ncbi:TPA: hypothetical protein DIS56_03585 [Candidatus Saccharibacteria bacterium]|nr:MAG: hypothetical protein A3F05_03890 [Candidatus Saccharibacteria bacterium RIFCSPHIGHO2_12_FULL_47_17]HCM52182.1 hypothetical protein [Candidatus Saccharibacteria bacterium]
MWAVLHWTFWQRRWSTLWWCTGVSSFIILSLSFYASFRDQAVQLNEVLSRLPNAAHALISDTTDFLTPEGFLSARLFYLLLPLLLSILAIGLGSSLIAKEEDRGTLEVLLSRPVSRVKLLAGKALAGLIIVLAVSLVSLITAVVVCRLVKLEVAFDRIILATLLSTLLALVFGVIAFAVAAHGRARAASVGIATLFGIASYLISSLDEVVEVLRFPAKLLPYHYYRPGEVLVGNFNWRFVTILVSVIAVLILFSFLSFRQRDLND